jgi:hypothetical protein
MYFVIVLEEFFNNFQIQKIKPAVNAAIIAVTIPYCSTIFTNILYISVILNLKF